MKYEYKLNEKNTIPFMWSDLYEKIKHLPCSSRQKAFYKYYFDNYKDKSREFFEALIADTRYDLLDWLYANTDIVERIEIHDTIKIQDIKMIYGDGRYEDGYKTATLMINGEPAIIFNADGTAKIVHFNFPMGDSQIKWR